MLGLVRMDEVRFTAAGKDGSFSAAGLGRRVRGGGLGLASESADDSLLLREGDLNKFIFIYLSSLFSILNQFLFIYHIQSKFYYSI